MAGLPEVCNGCGKKRGRYTGTLVDYKGHVHGLHGCTKGCLEKANIKLTAELCASDAANIEHFARIEKEKKEHTEKLIGQYKQHKPAPKAQETTSLSGL